jgi:lipopolysaccharide biosynthesis protein
VTDSDNLSTSSFLRNPSFGALSDTAPRNQYTSEEFQKDASKIIAFYLPQYHEIKENSEWWGPGFTDWVNVAKARPLYPGHYQPHIPRELGFYDASLPSVLEAQTQLARKYNVYGFCFYWYWFDGRKILEKPIETFLDSNIDFNFCFCWANETWARTWDGNPKHTLIEQNYGEGFEKRLINDFSPYWQEDRYIKVDGRPLLLIYRINDIPNIKEVIATLRQESQSLLNLNPYIVGVDFYDMPDEVEIGLDGIVEFPPHKFWGDNNAKKNPQAIIPSYTGKIIDYSKVIVQSLGRKVSDHRRLYRACFPSWDNTARIGDRAIVIENQNAMSFERWLQGLRQYTRENLSSTDNFIFINAWNEWAEGAHLEPDLHMGTSFLEALVRSENYLPSGNYLDLESVKNSLNISNYTRNSNVYFDSQFYSPKNGLVQKIGNLIFHVSPLFYKLVRFVFRAFKKMRKFE